jgi:hypothetical protein
MTRARWRGGEYQLVNFTEDGEYVLRDASGDVAVTDGVELDRQTVEVQCDRCGRWTVHAITMPGDRWVCADTRCYYDERGRG